jgi:hypothetical protein
MEEFKILARTMKALQQEKERQERLELQRLEETNKELRLKVHLECIRRRREKEVQRDLWLQRQEQHTHQKHQEERKLLKEERKVLLEREIENLLQFAQNAEGIEAERLRLLARRYELEIMQIERAGLDDCDLINVQIQRIDNRLGMVEKMLQTQEEFLYEAELKEVEEAKLREEAERTVNMRRALEQRYPDQPNVVEEILLELKRLKVARMAQKSNFNQ